MWRKKPLPNASDMAFDPYKVRVAHSMSLNFSGHPVTESLFWI